MFLVKEKWPKLEKEKKKKKAKTLWICAVAALFWVMWQERDLLIF